MINIISNYYSFYRHLNKRMLMSTISRARYSVTVILYLRFFFFFFFTYAQAKELDKRDGKKLSKNEENKPVEIIEESPPPPSRKLCCIPC